MIGLLLAIPGAVKRWAIIAALAIGALAATWLGGRKSARTNDKIKRQDEALQTHERINEAPHADNPTDARAWLDAHSERLRDGRKP